ncbi:16738_t:CDS:1, partial [Gigaspora margarita]
DSSMESNEETDERETGTVKWFSDEKGYGFITPNDGGEDLFVHHSEIRRTGFKSLREGNCVEYEMRKGQKGGRHAVNVRLPDETKSIE